MIPKFLHFIWIGSKIPAKYVDNVESFVRNNQNYKIILWVDHDTSPISKVEIRHVKTLTLTNQNLYDKEINYGAKADILRYEIVYQLGGIYNDIDAISIKPFDYIFDQAFVSHTYEPWNNLTNAIFGFPAKHEFLRTVLKCLPHSSGHDEVHYRTGPYFFTDCFLNYTNSKHLPWAKACGVKSEINLIHQDQLVYPKDTTNKNRLIGYTYHLNDANWTTKPAKPRPKLSLCTTVKNRLCHISQTLPQNIVDAGPNAELVVLDYASNDGLAEWIKPFVANGLVNYFRAEGQDYWQSSHAKNVSTLASSCGIICNVDADNFVTEGFTDRVLNFYQTSSGVFAAPDAMEGVTGRIAMKRADFEALGGYDEVYNFGWGCEDVDLVIRAEAMGLPVTRIDLRYLKQIPHNNEMRGQCSRIKEIVTSNTKGLAIMREKLKARQFIANSGKPWGCCDLVMNYQIARSIGSIPSVL